MVQAFIRRSPACSLRRAFTDVAGPAAYLVVWFTMGALAAGCSGQPPLEEPKFSPAEAAQQAMQQYDKNHDGQLDAKELEKCPALLGLLHELDGTEEKSSQHKDGVLRADEIQNRLEQYQAAHAALVGVNCRVYLDGQPFEGASVTLVPEEFMGPSFKPARGVSDAQGVVRLVTEGHDVPGVALGYYRIEVSKKDAGEHEMLPAQYNRSTILGRELSPLRRGGNVLKLELSSS